MKQIQPTALADKIYPRKENIDGLATSANTIIKVCFWDGTEFSNGEISESKNLIRRFLLMAADPYNAYLEFCQRAFLTKLHDEYADAFIPVMPSIWLTHKKGFACSAKWYKELLQKRSTDPLYGLSLRALAEAMLEMTEGPSHDLCKYWLNWFREREAHDEIILFTKFYSFINRKNFQS